MFEMYFGCFNYKKCSLKVNLLIFMERFGEIEFSLADLEKNF